jgi:signal peptidase I
MRRGRIIVLILPCLVFLASCGGKDGGTTIVLTTTEGKTQTTLPIGVYRIPSGSMEPTLKIGERVMAESKPPRVGDIVIFHPPEGATEEECGGGVRISPGGAPCDTPVPKEDTGIKFIKRIVAGPGDTIKIVEGHVIRNDQRETDAYIRPCPAVSECNFPVPIKIPAGDWFLLGDNRGESDDSRFWGPIPASWIVGVVRGTPIAGD